MNNFTLYHNELYGNYFDVCEETLLGDLTTPLDAMEEKFRKHILNYMPAMNDPNCLQCPAIGGCWGQCLSHRPLTGLMPSNHCHQKSLVDNLEQFLLKDENIETIQITAGEREGRSCGKCENYTF